MNRLLCQTAVAAALCAALPSPAAPPAPTLENALEAYNRLDLDEARSVISRLKKDDTGALDELKARIILASNMMERVEKIEIVDSLTVPATDFFRSIRLAPQTGRFLDEEELYATGAVEREEGTGISEPVFATEDGRTLLWTAIDLKGDESSPVDIMKSTRLADGSWTNETFIERDRIFSDGDAGDVSTPFMMADGVTYYFAADGAQSLGGLDIFVARRDGDGFLQPANVGMPFNSPANDYMMAIDEVTGLGWFVTDRDAPEDMVRIFVFVPSEQRVNIDPDTEGLADIALLRNLAPYSRDGEESHADLLARLDAATASAGRKAAPEFEFAMPDGRIITSMSQLQSDDARDLMQERVALLRDRDELLNVVASMRRSYGRGDRSESGRILASERRLDEMNQRLRKLSNDIVECETYHRQRR